jgi:hypothetical protein
MITRHSCPPLPGVAGNNGYRLRVVALPRLAGLAFTDAHPFDVSAVPRGELPTSSTTATPFGDRDAIIRAPDRQMRPRHRGRTARASSEKDASGRLHHRERQAPSGAPGIANDARPRVRATA